MLLAWITGRIKWGGGAQTQGWVDTATGSPIDDLEVKSRHEADMLAHAGIRIIEPALFHGYDPKNKGKVFMHAVSLHKDMAWMGVSGEEEAREYVGALGEWVCDVAPPSSSSEGGGGPWQVRLRKGAVITVPMALRFDRWVAGQIPTGWDATAFGVPADLAGRMDPVTRTPWCPRSRPCFPRAW